MTPRPPFPASAIKMRVRYTKRFRVQVSCLLWETADRLIWSPEVKNKRRILQQFLGACFHDSQKAMQNTWNWCYVTLKLLKKHTLKMCFDGHVSSVMSNAPAAALFRRNSSPAVRINHRSGARNTQMGSLLLWMEPLFSIMSTLWLILYTI